MVLGGLTYSIRDTDAHQRLVLSTCLYPRIKQSPNLHSLMETLYSAVCPQPRKSYSISPRSGNGFPYLNTAVNSEFHMRHIHRSNTSASFSSSKYGRQESPKNQKCSKRMWLNDQPVRAMFLSSSHARTISGAVYR